MDSEAECRSTGTTRETDSHPRAVFSQRFALVLVVNRSIYPTKTDLADAFLDQTNHACLFLNLYIRTQASFLHTQTPKHTHIHTHATVCTHHGGRINKERNGQAKKARGMQWSCQGKLEICFYECTVAGGGYLSVASRGPRNRRRRRWYKFYVILRFPATVPRTTGGGQGEKGDSQGKETKHWSEGVPPTDGARSRFHVAHRTLRDPQACWFASCRATPPHSLLEPPDVCQWGLWGREPAIRPVVRTEVCIDFGNLPRPRGH